jgi:cell division protein FtsI/penicillin-binding protein 2
MQNQSPLLRKAREGYGRSRFRIPRRGRLRILLLLVAVGVAARFYFDGEQPSKASAGPPVEQPLSVDSAPKETAPASVESATKVDYKLGWKRTLDREAIREILEQSPPRLDGHDDTVALRNGRAVFHYSLNAELQKRGKRLLKRYHPKYGAIVALEPATGRVVAMISYNNPDEPPLDRHLFCRSIFPAASIFKVITAAGAVEKAGMREETELRRAGQNHTLYRFQLEPELARYNLISLGDAFAYSINPVFGRLGIYTLKADGVLEYAQRFGFAARLPFDLPHEPCRVAVVDSPFALAELASGFNQQTTISPLFGALIAAAVSHRGAMPVPTVVDSVTEPGEEKCLYRAQQRLWRAPVRPETAWELAELMKGVVRYGTARRSFNTYIRRSRRFARIDCGGKTGSVDKDGVGRVDWFVGFARHQSDPRQHLATGVVTVHGDNWTVHSSFLAAEIIRAYIREVQTGSDTMEVASRE